MNQIGTMNAYFIEYASQETTAEEVGEAFNRAFGGSFVSRVVGTTTQDYKTYWKSFTVFFNDSCVDNLFKENMNFHDFLGRYVLYYNDTEYWDVHLIQIDPNNKIEIVDYPV